MQFGDGLLAFSSRDAVGSEPEGLKIPNANNRPHYWDRVWNGLFAARVGRALECVRLVLPVTVLERAAKDR